MSGIAELERFELPEPAKYFSASLIRHQFDRDEMMRKAVATIKRINPAFEEVPEDRLFLFSAVISNQQLDSYFTKMADSSLMNYAADAKEGRAFLDSHNINNRIGYSLDGLFENSGTPIAEYPRVLADFYCVSGIKLGAIETDMFIESVKFGILRDVSIGFCAKEKFRYTCSICGLSMWDWDCWHCPGVEYTYIENPDDEPSRQIERSEICFAWVEDAGLSEVSGVYDGATPKAEIIAIKAAREVRAGRMKDETLRFLTQRYRIELPKTDKKFNGIGDRNKTENKELNKNMPEENTFLTSVRQAAIRAGITGVTADTSEAETLRLIEAEFNGLTALRNRAATGDRLFKDLIDEACRAGVTALGKDFNEETERESLKAMSVDIIRSMKSSWETLGSKRFAGDKGKPNRQTRNETTDEDLPETEEEETPKGENEETDELPDDISAEDLEPAVEDVP